MTDPSARPFLTLYTPTYRRPRALARCLASVQAQTAVDDLEQLVVVDHVGVGVDGMYARVPLHAPAVRGRYVTFLCDDDVLASPTVVEEVRAFVASAAEPELVIVSTDKGGSVWPAGNPWPPRMGAIDLNCAIVRGDVWRRHAEAGAYGARYEGDYDFLAALHRAGVAPAWCGLLFSRGGVSRGAPEAPGAV